MKSFLDRGHSLQRARLPDRRWRLKPSRTRPRTRVEKMGWTQRTGIGGEEPFGTAWGQRVAERSGAAGGGAPREIEAELGELAGSDEPRWDAHARSLPPPSHTRSDPSCRDAHLLSISYVNILGARTPHRETSRRARAPSPSLRPLRTNLWPSP